MTPSVLHKKKKLKKKRKIKFDIKIEFFKIKENGYLLAEKNKGWKWTFQANLKAATYVTHLFHFNPLSFNLTFFFKKKKANEYKFGLKKAQL